MDAGDFDSWNVKQLKAFLREHGELISGNKKELISRAKGTIFLQKKSVNETSVEDAVADGVRRIEKLVTPLNEILPEPCTLRCNWSYDINLFPSVSNNDLYNYLVLSKHRTFDNERMMATRQLKAKVFYEDRHVHGLQFHKINDDCSHCFIKSKVIPSLPSDKGKTDYEVWVCLSKVTGGVQSASCTCAAGEGEACNHISALLYALVDITEKRKEGLHASTSHECKWINRGNESLVQKGPNNYHSKSTNGKFPKLRVKAMRTVL